MPNNNNHHNNHNNVMICKKIFLTGMPGVGKTTCLQTVVQRIQQQQQQQHNNNNNNNNIAVQVNGFYTQERRRGGQHDDDHHHRIGFDIISYNNNKNGVVPLARIVEASSSSVLPMVGKYAVCLDNIQSHMVEPLKLLSLHQQQQQHSLTILDEVGKMELKCPDFFPTIWNYLNTTSSNNITLGTLPLMSSKQQPLSRIMKRSDVWVLHVTKTNRDQLTKDLTNYVLQQLVVVVSSNKDENCLDSSSWLLEKYRLETNTYNNHNNNNNNRKQQQPQPQPQQRRERNDHINNKNRKQNNNNNNDNNDTNHNNSLSNPKLTTTTTTTAQQTTTTAITTVFQKPCPPLVSKEIPPKILLLGETASPFPEHDPNLAYHERSMWKVLSRIIIIGGGETTAPYNNDNNSYKQLVQSTLDRGIAIWDVLSNVHDKTSSSSSKQQQQQQQRRRQRNHNNNNNNNNNNPKSKQQQQQQEEEENNNNIPNPSLLQFLETEYPTIQVCCFIGSKAYQTFVQYFCQDNHNNNNSSSQQQTKKPKTMTLSNHNRTIDLVVLPSSSHGNKMPLSEKATQWKTVFDRYMN